jgi:predicted RNA-binding Zn-ribbon protein involved in translation (DUF1610 family)
MRADPDARPHAAITPAGTHVPWTCPNCGQAADVKAGVPIRCTCGRTSYAEQQTPTDQARAVIRGYAVPRRPSLNPRARSYADLRTPHADLAPSTQARLEQMFPDRGVTMTEWGFDQFTNRSTYRNAAHDTELPRPSVTPQAEHPDPTTGAGAYAVQVPPHMHEDLPAVVAYWTHHVTNAGLTPAPDPRVTIERYTEPLTLHIARGVVTVPDPEHPDVTHTPCVACPHDWTPQVADAYRAAAARPTLEHPDRPTVGPCTCHLHPGHTTAELYDGRCTTCRAHCPMLATIELDLDAPAPLTYCRRCFSEQPHIDCAEAIPPTPALTATYTNAVHEALALEEARGERDGSWRDVHGIPPTPTPTNLQVSDTGEGPVEVQSTTQMTPESSLSPSQRDGLRNPGAGSAGSVAGRDGSERVRVGSDEVGAPYTVRERLDARRVLTATEVAADTVVTVRSDGSRNVSKPMLIGGFVFYDDVEG